MEDAREGGPKRLCECFKLEGERSSNGPVEKVGVCLVIENVAQESTLADAASSVEDDELCPFRLKRLLERVSLSGSVMKGERR